MPDDSNHNKVPTDIHSNACDLPISIRPLDVNDTTELHAVVTLVNKAYRTHTNWTNEADIVTGDRVTFASLREQCTKWHHLIAEHTLQNIIVGVIQVGNTDHTIAGTLHEPCGYFGMLAVHGQFQSCGIGSRLINSAELFCKEKGMRSMVSCSFPFNRCSLSIFFGIVIDLLVILFFFSIDHYCA